MPRLLIVEDELGLRKALEVRLSASGFACETAKNGKEALDMIGVIKPDAILTDLRMPVMDGYELCKELKKNKGTESIPVVVLTALPKRAIAPRLAELGGARILYKPCESQELVEAIQESLKSSS